MYTTQGVSGGDLASGTLVFDTFDSESKIPNVPLGKTDTAAWDLFTNSLPSAQSNLYRILMLQETKGSKITKSVSPKFFMYNASMKTSSELTNDILNSLSAMVEFPERSVLSSNPNFLTITSQDGKLMANAFNSTPDPFDSLSKIKIDMDTKQLDGLAASASTGTITGFSRIDNQGVPVFDFLIPTADGITHITFSVTEDLTRKLQISGVTKHEYKLKNPDFYDCKLSADYIICGGYDSDSVPSSTFVNDSVDMWMHFIKRVDGAEKGDGQSIMFQYKCNDDIYPGLYPKNQFVVQNFQHNIISYIEPNTRKVVTISVENFVQRVNSETYHQFWKFFFVSAAVILLVLFACINAGNQLGKTVNWDEVRARAGLKPISANSVDQNSGSDEFNLPEKNKSAADDVDGGYTLTS